MTLRGDVWHPGKDVVRQNVRLDQYDAADGWVHDLSAVAGQPRKYWLQSGDTAVLMDQAARDAVDAQEALAQAAAEKADEKGRFDTERLMKAFAGVMTDEINLLRAEHALTPRTLPQLRTSIRAKIDAG